MPAETDVTTVQEGVKVVTPKAPKASIYMSAADIRGLLATKYAAPTHSTFFEVADATGARHTGWADAITMSLWPSHGLHVDGFEIKVSKYDWQKELANPLKAEKFAARCDKWWIVASEGVIADISEIPEKWGYMLATPEKLSIIRPATVNPDPLPLDRLFLASILRSADKASDSLLTKVVEERVKRLRDSDEDRIKTEINRRIGNSDQGTRILDAVMTRIKPDGWRWLEETAVVDAIVAVYKSGVLNVYDGLQGAVKACEDAAQKMREAYSELGLDVPARKPLTITKRKTTNG